MSTLLLRLAAPLQSWGLDGAFESRRSTERTPTKSGVIGLCAAAMGISREDDSAIATLSGLKYGARVDKEGILLRDYHTAKGEKPYVTNRFYLCDAVFIAGLEGEDDILCKIDEALRYPAFPLFLGRRSCPPEGRLSLGITKKPLLDALESLEGTYQRILIDDASGNVLQRDNPISFSQISRKYGFRRAVEILNLNRNSDEIDYYAETEVSE